MVEIEAWKEKKCLKNISFGSVAQIDSGEILLIYFYFSNGKLNILSLYLHRYLRMTPLLGVCVLVSVSLYRFLGNGPVWPISVHFFNENCKHYWWSALLHIQNYVNPGQICMPNTWYISVDFQLFFITPFIVHLIHRLKAKALIILFILILGCIGLTLALHWYYNLTLL